MTPLITAIYSKFTSTPVNAFYTAMAGRMYHAEAPQDSTFPYAVVFSVSHEQDWNFSHSFEDVLVQFSIFTNESSASNIGTYWANLKSLYDDTALTITGYSKVHMVRTNSNLFRDTENNIWHYSVEYECILVAS